MPYIQAEHGLIHHHTWTPFAEPRSLVLLLHGLGEHLGLYESLALRLTAADAEVHALDLAGHGHSHGARVLVTDVDALVADAAAVLRQATDRRPGLPVVVVGHSLGATVAALLAARLPREPAGLVLSGSDLLGRSPIGDLADGDADPLTFRKDPSELSSHPGHLERVRTDPLVWSGGVHRETLRALADAARRTAALVERGGLTVPTLLVHGEADDLAPVGAAREVADRLPDARLAVFPGDRHNVLNEADRARVHAVVAGFLREVTARKESPIR